MLFFIRKKAEYSLCYKKFRFGRKRLVLGQMHDQRQRTKNIVEQLCITTKCVQIFVYAVRDTMPKIKSRHLVFKTSIAAMKTCVFIGAYRQIFCA